MTIKEMRMRTGLTQAEFSRRLGIPARTLQDWERGIRQCPQYVANLMVYYLKNEGFFQESKDLVINPIGKVKIADEIAKLSLRSEKTKAGTPYIWETVYKMPDGTNGLIRWEDQRIVFQPLDDFKTNAEGIRTIPNHQCRALTRKDYQAIPFLCSDEKEALPEIL